MDKPRIPVDFNEVAGNIVLLSKGDSRTDSAGRRIVFQEGMPVSVYEENEEDGRPDNLIADGVAVLNPLAAEHPMWAHVKWCCRMDGNGIRYESDIERERG
ncbi:MAG: hypothetical protein FWH47_07095 [Methanomassiliicoccaceae archaeon]|nr:hypothetical protein [Methanomassiliicoccaceae archaeon]